MSLLTIPKRKHKTYPWLPVGYRYLEEGEILSSEKKDICWPYGRPEDGTEYELVQGWNGCVVMARNYRGARLIETQ